MMCVGFVRKASVHDLGSVKTHVMKPMTPTIEADDVVIIFFSCFTARGKLFAVAAVSSSMIECDKRNHRILSL